MCELLAMSANTPTDICFSFRALARRGGTSGPHVDGWGVTFYDGKGCRTFKDTQPSSVSPIAKILENHPIKSELVIAHIRQANQGKVALENTHPFTRELWGKNWTFAHNGQLSDYISLETGCFIPIGKTDSEHAFCYILHRLSEHYLTPPEDTISVFKFVTTCAKELSKLGVFNIILTDGQYLFAHCGNHLHLITRRCPFGKAKMIDDENEIDFSTCTSEKDVVSVIATQPLTSNEPWLKLAPGDAVLLNQGERIF